jgi:hypothetical protein
MLIRASNNGSDDASRLQQRLGKADFSESLFSTAEAKYFRDAIEHVAAEHERLRSSGDRTAIRIG